MSREIIGFPRHLSQHVGGFLITRSRLDEVVPILHSAMDGRNIIEWDKDDLDALKMLKIDVLALGMLTCLKKGFDLLAAHYGETLDLALIPEGDEAVYDMICRADTIGVFQIESRAQMTMLPRLRPAPSTTSSSRWRSSAPGRSRATWCIPISAAGRGWRR